MALIPVTPAKDRRVLHHGDKGDDVKAFGRMLARTLKALGFAPVNAQNGIYGDGMLNDTLRLQHAKGIQPSGRVGALTWSAVDPQMHAYERYLLRKRPPPPTPIGVRIAHEMRVLLAFGMPIYTQRRAAAQTTPVWRHQGSDCSASGLLSRANALGVPYDGWGNTDTIWTTGTPVEEASVQLGDYIIYGSFSPFKTKHTQVVSNLSPKLCIGFGSAPGGEYTWDYRGDRMGFRRMAH